jgi:hypothetical protein
VSDDKAPVVPKRGEAAWKAVKDGVAARNEAAKRAGKEERQEHLRNAQQLRGEANARRAARVNAPAKGKRGS